MCHQSRKNAPPCSLKATAVNYTHNVKVTDTTMNILPVLPLCSAEGNTIEFQATYFCPNQTELEGVVTETISDNHSVFYVRNQTETDKFKMKH